MQGQGRSRAGMRGRGGMIGGGGGGYQYHRQQQQPGVMYPLGWEFQHLAYAQQAQQHVQALVQPMYGRAAAAGPSQRGFLPLGVQGAGILKPPAGLPQGPLLYGRGHARGQQRGRGWGGLFICLCFFFWIRVFVIEGMSSSSRNPFLKTSVSFWSLGFGKGVRSHATYRVFLFLVKASTIC